MRKIFTLRSLIFYRMNLRCKGCGKCCYETEMIISEQDIERILHHVNLISKREDFANKNKDGLHQLKNTNGHCVFLNGSSQDKKCRIYPYRPQGCRFYPMIFDPSKMKCILDKECPNSSRFYTEDQQFQKRCQDLRKFLENELSLKF